MIVTGKHNDRLISQYARWDEDIHPVLKPILHEHGFSLSFRTSTKQGVSVEAVLAHSQGHSERTSIDLPSDTSGSKNAVQAVASSVSYGKRYTAGALLNLATGGQDDDGKAAGQKPRITEQQAADLQAKIDKVLGKNTKGFYTWLRTTHKANKLEDLNQNGFDDAIRRLNLKAKENK